MFRDRWNKVEEIIHNEMIKTYDINISKNDIEDVEYPAYVQYVLLKSKYI